MHLLAIFFPINSHFFICLLLENRLNPLVDGIMQKTFDFTGYIKIIVREWKFITLNLIIAGSLAIGYSFFIAEKQFMATVTFFPPFEDKSLLSILPGGTGASLFSTDIVPQQIRTIFQSKGLKRKVIEKFHFYEKFKLTKSLNKFEQALKRLQRDLTLNIDEVGSLGMTKHIAYTISCYHTSADTSYKIVDYTFSLIDSMIKEVSVDRGRRNREFIEKQLILTVNTLDSMQKEFEQFQKSNKIFNIPRQIHFSLNNYAQFKAKILANNVQIKKLRQDFSQEYPQILSLKKENAVLATELIKMEKQSQPDILIGLEKSTEMLPKYTNYIRDIEIQNKLILLLTQQLEEAKLKEARDISSLKVIDPAFIPEYKARPKRILLVLTFVSAYVVFMFFILFMDYLYSSLIKNSAIFYEITHSIITKK